MRSSGCTRGLRVNVILSLVSVFMLASFGRSGPQALCALRDPVRQIKRLFPNADAYESVVGTVGQTTRATVARRLPFTLHFNELGRHTLYVVKREELPVGLVHVRSEAGQWGLVEIAWALDMDLRVLGYEFQRCRDRSKAALASKTVVERLSHMDFARLRGLINEEGDSLTDRANFIPKKARPLASTVVRSALKTIAVTESVWSEEVSALRALALARQHHPAARRATPLPQVFGVEERAAIEKELGSEGSGIDHERSMAHVVHDGDGRRLGWVAETPWTLDEREHVLRWCFDTNGTIQSIDARGGWDDDELAQAFEQVTGMSASDAVHCCGASGVIALEVAIGIGLSRLDDPR